LHESEVDQLNHQIKTNRKRLGNSSRVCKSLKKINQPKSLNIENKAKNKHLNEIRPVRDYQSYRKQDRHNSNLNQIGNEPT